VNPIRFSTQYADDWTGDLKYLHRDYRPDLGRWLNRDPIGERGARLLEKYGAARASDRFDSLAGKRSGRSPVRREEFNLYAFVENAPTIYIDIDGRQAAPGGGKGALPNVSYPAQPIGCSLTCCDDDKIEEGRRTLRRRYLQAVQAATALGLTPVNPPKQGATCKNSSLDFINWLLPYPPCWYCYLEERDYTANDPNDQGFDHQVIICNAYGSLGSIKKQIMFDWWGQTTWNKPYGDENPTSVTGGTYHSPNQQTSPKHFIDCQGVTHGKPQPKDFNSCTAKE
jgi:RHS repeat-associated protein